MQYNDFFFEKLKLYLILHLLNVNDKSGSKNRTRELF